METGFHATYSSVTRRIVLAFLVLFPTLPGLCAQSTGAPPDVRQGYEALRDAVYNSEALVSIEAFYRDAVGLAAAADLPEADRNLWRSRIEYMVARGYQANEDKARSVAHYESGLSALDGLAPDQVSSESWRMTSECISQLCLLKPVGWVVANGPKVASYAEKALELDPRNAAAQVIVAAARIYPPAMFGGNPKRGIELMQEALSFGTAQKDDLFNIYSGVGLAYGKLKNAAEARRWFDMALALYPGNSYVRSERAKLGKD
jgi:tetratricopeptide (TPR) repeat protein